MNKISRTLIIILIIISLISAIVPLVGLMSTIFALIIYHLVKIKNLYFIKKI